MPARRTALLLLVLAPALLAGAEARAQIREGAIVDSSTVVFQEIATIPEQGIPRSLLRDAEGFAIVPGLIKAGFLVGGRYGRGVVVVRNADRTWSNPIFVTIAGGSFGFQAGAQATDLILVFRSRKSIDGFLQGRGKFTLGADASIAAGPVGRQASASTDVRLESEILSYSRSRGLFAGISLDGASLSLDWNACVAYYGQVVAPFEGLSRRDLPIPVSAVRLRNALSQASGMPMIVPAQPAAGASGSSPVISSRAVRTGTMAWKRVGSTAPVESTLAGETPAPAASPGPVIVSTPGGTVANTTPTVLMPSPAPPASATAPKVIVSTPTGVRR